MKCPLILLLWIAPILCYAHDHEKDSLLVKKERSSLDNQFVSNFYQFPELDKNFPVKKSITISSAPEFTTESIQREYGIPGTWANDNRLKAKASFEKIETEDKWISSFSNTHLDALPVGVKHTISEIEYQLGFVKAKFYKEYTELTVFVKVVLPQSDDKGDPIELFFGADNVKLSHEGGIIGDANLVLLGDIFIPFNGGNWMLFLKGGLDFKTGNVQNKTFATINCDGVKEMGIEGGIEFSRNLLLPVGENGETLPKTRPWPNGNKTSMVPNRVRGDFKAVASNWNDLVVGVGITPFVLANHEDGFMFSVSKAILDFSDLRTPDVSFPGYYHENGLLLPNRESWRGVYIESIEVGMPEAFKTTNSVSKNKRVTFEAANLIIDSHGVSGEFSIKNIIPLETGITSSQNAWAYSVDELGVVYAANNFMGAKFAGSIRLPTSGVKDKGLKYKGIITDEEYMMAVSPVETVSFDILQAKVQLLPNSGVLMRVKNSDDQGNDTETEGATPNNKKEFFMQARLNGRMAISASQKQSILDEGKKVDDDIVKFKGITFENLVLQTESPLISVKYFGYEDQVKVAGFPVSIDRIGVVAQDREIGVKFDIGVSLMKDAFAAKGGVGIFAKQKQVPAGSENSKEDNRYKQRWQYDRLELSRMIVKANMGAIAFEGALDLMDNDPIYGDGFKAKVKATFFKKEGSEGSDKGISCAAIFGKTRTKQNVEVTNEETETKETVTTEGYRYWYIDAAVTGLKIPVFPGLNITGFAGGAFYKMSRKPEGSISEFSPSGLTYIPDNKTLLGVKAMVFGAMPDEKAMSVSAGFEIDFNENYGVNRLGFFGEVQAMKAFDFPNPMGKITGKLQGLANSESLGSKVVKTFSEKAESEYPSEITGQAGVNAKVGMQYDFTNNTFHADMDLYVNVAGGLVQGRASKGRAGWGVIHISPDEWYVHMGTPTDRLGLKMGVGSVFVESGGYFMMGDGLPGSPPPPSEVATMLGVDIDKLDYMRDENSLKSGKGLAFGSDFKIDTGDISFLLLYARFRAGLGFDIMLKDYQQAMCVNTGDQVGINGWYANGQAYAYLQGELGIKVKLFAVSKKVPIIQGGAAILMQAKGPNPFWMRGYAAGYYDLLGGAVKGAYRFKVEVGEMCEFQDDTPVGDIKMISDLTPADNDQNVDVFMAPQATFVMKVGEPITISENGGDKTYKILLDKFMVTDASGKVTPGKLEWAHTKDRVTFMPDDILPPQTRLKAIVALSFQEKINGVYRDVMLNGKKALETLERSFTTATAPDYIPLNNIKYAYPVVNQKQFYKGESTSGYIQLQKGQDYLFDNSQWQSTVKFIDQNGKLSLAKFSYNTAENKVMYTLPKIDKEATYTMSIVSTSIASGNSSEGAEVTETTNYDEDNTMEIKKNSAANVLKEGEIERITYEFKTSKYKKFADKIKAMSVTHNNVGAVGSSSDMIYLYSYITPNEGFDLVELLGNTYTANKPLVSYEATLVDTYYQKDIEPLVYANYPISGTYLLRNRDPGILGISPKRALPIKSSYLTSLEKNQNKTLIQTHFPFEYDLPRIYKQDFIDLRNQVLKDFTNNVISGAHPAMRLIDGDYLFMRYGKYEMVLKYVLPGGIEASQAKFDFKNPLEYRM
ncbi:hypothetical protein [Aquimarina megaterium]|uniref:hypothetical protein n=1 Tax=Aquimarina megaterium TaxID=1443666 RepID=UPI000943DFC4|nr:hypothetical protein [Aquimarina megaterium]